MVVSITTAEKNNAVAALTAYNTIQKDGATDSGTAIDDVVVASTRAEQSGQSNTPLFLPVDKLDAAIDRTNMSPEQIVYKQLSDNVTLAIFLAVGRMMVPTRWLLTTRAQYGVTPVNPADTSLLLTETVRSNATNVDGVPIDVDLTARYVEIIDPATERPMLVQAGLHAGERVYGVVDTGVGPGQIVVNFQSRVLGTNPALAGSAYSWEAALGSTVNVFYGYRQRMDQIDDTAFRRVLR